MRAGPLGLELRVAHCTEVPGQEGLEKNLGSSSNCSTPRGVFLQSLQPKGVPFSKLHKGTVGYQGPAFRCSCLSFAGDRCKRAVENLLPELKDWDLHIASIILAKHLQFWAEALEALDVALSKCGWH